MAEVEEERNKHERETSQLLVGHGHEAEHINAGKPMSLGSPPQLIEQMSPSSDIQHFIEAPGGEIDFDEPIEEYVPSLPPVKDDLEAWTKIYGPIRNPDGTIRVQGMGGNAVTFREGDEWMRLYQLGEGAYAECYLACTVKTGFTYCIKQIKGYENQCEDDQMLEVSIMSSLVHNVVPCYGAALCDDDLLIFLKWMPGRTLEQFIVDYCEKDISMGTPVILNYTKQLLSGISDMHQKQIVHGDIKADNILLNDDSQKLYYTDFGNAQRIHHYDYGTQCRLIYDDLYAMKCVFSRLYLAPDNPNQLPDRITKSKYHDEKVFKIAQVLDKQISLDGSPDMIYSYSMEKAETILSSLLRIED